MTRQDQAQAATWVLGASLHRLNCSLHLVSGLGMYYICLLVTEAETAIRDFATRLEGAFVKGAESFADIAKMDAQNDESGSVESFLRGDLGGTRNHLEAYSAIFTDNKDIIFSLSNVVSNNLIVLLTKTHASVKCVLLYSFLNSNSITENEFRWDGNGTSALRGKV